MSKKVILLIATAVLLTGCGSTAQSKYDEVELIIYQNCIEKGTGGMENFMNSEFYLDNAIKACKKYRPGKQ